MSEHPAIPAEMTDAALAAAPMLQRFYCAGGGSPWDLRTDLSHALAAAITVPQPREPVQERRVLDLRVTDLRGYTGPDRRRSRVPYTGPERRRTLLRRDEAS